MVDEFAKSFRRPYRILINLNYLNDLMNSLGFNGYLWHNPFIC